jgi:hypothetical protein
LTNIVAKGLGVVNAQRRSFTLNDFLLDTPADAPASEPPRQTWQEQLHIVEMWNALYGGRDLRPPPEPLVTD